MFPEKTYEFHLSYIYDVNSCHESRFNAVEITNYILYGWNPLRLFLIWMVPSPILTWLLFLFFFCTFFIYSIWNPCNTLFLEFFSWVFFFFYLSENFHQIWISFLLCCYSPVLVFICFKHNINPSWIIFSSINLFYDI